MSKISRKPWWVVEVTYETMGGEYRTDRSKPFRSMSEALVKSARYKQVGYQSEVIAVEPPARIRRDD
jgi:hypothetical protein